jgi:hypothetical protein
LTDEDKEPYAKKARDHQAKQNLMKECIVDALRKAKGGNCSRSYASLAKVKRTLMLQWKSYKTIIQDPLQPIQIRQQGTGVINRRFCYGSNPNLITACIRRGSNLDCQK